MSKQLLSASVVFLFALVMNYVSHPMNPGMDEPDIPACFDGSHASLIPIPGLEPSYKNLWSTWSMMPIKTQTPYGEMARDARQDHMRQRPITRTGLNEVLRQQGKRTATESGN